MSDWLSFEGRVTAMEWGNNVYTVLPLPEAVSEALARQNARRVEIELNDVPFNMALTKAPVIDAVFVYTGKSVLKEAGIAPGELLDVRLRKADAAIVDLPEDVALALRAHALTAKWEALTAGKRRGLLHTVTSAKRAETRKRRITALIDQMQGGTFPPA